MKKKLLAAIFGAVLVLGACGGEHEQTNDERCNNRWRNSFNRC